jgi:hypothetical protein
MFNVTGLQWNGTADVAIGTKIFNVPACNETADCTLSQQIIDSIAGPLFTNLTAINMTAMSDGELQTWWADDIQLGWTDRSCDTAVCRSKVRNTAMKRKAWLFGAGTRRLTYITSKEVN